MTWKYLVKNVENFLYNKKLLMLFPDTDLFFLACQLYAVVVMHVIYWFNVFAGREVSMPAQIYGIMKSMELCLT